MLLNITLTKSNQ